MEEYFLEREFWMFNEEICFFEHLGSQSFFLFCFEGLDFLKDLLPLLIILIFQI